MDVSFQEGKPENYKELKNAANNIGDWKVRKSAVEDLSKWKCRESIDILWRRMMSDKVYSVQRAAFIGLQSFGENAKLPKKKKGNLISDIDKKLKIVKNKLSPEHTYEEFKESFSKLYPVEYNTYEGDKLSQLDSWLMNKWNSLPKK